MAHGRVLRKLYEQYGKSLKESHLSGLSLDISGSAEKVSSPGVENFPCQDRFFIGELRKRQLPEEGIRFSGDTTCTVSGSGIIVGEVNSDATLCFAYTDSQPAIPFVFLHVRPGVRLTIAELFSGQHLYKNMIVYLEEGATLYFSQNAYAGHVNNTWVYLKRNAEYELRSTYYVKGHQTYLFNGVYHLEGSTSALLQIQGAARDQAHVLNDGMVRIEKYTGNCKGYQSINGLLLDRTSQISNEPMLEIYNSDVECSHGASVTQIEDQLLYYMQSRGLTKEEVIDLVVEGYFAWSWESLDATALEFMKGYREQLMLQH